jgi:rubrerythrin
MQAMIQVRDAFDLARQFHQNLSEFYAGLAGQTERTRVKLLLDWLSRHEANLQTCLQRYEDDRSHDVLDTWMEYAPEASPFEGLDALTEQADLSVDAVADLAIKLDDALVTFYQDLVEHVESPEVRKLFETLLTMARHDEQDLKRRIEALWRPHGKH